jgi:hypothetical protein
MTSPVPNCGTYAAAQRRRRRGELVDAACRDAAAKYQAEWRHRQGKTSTRVLMRQRDEARAELAATHAALRTYVVGE